MQVEWTKLAARDLYQIKSYIHKDNPEVARKVAISIAGYAETLAEFPNRGRVGRLYNTKELILIDLPYIIVYRVKKKIVQILRVIHTSRKWPV
ncbi:MAG: type II toxin-antitoxin system RelE/ParE family toxin [Acidobacteria bacterium]|nr:type II toxin-antitoxin system RelE/ParE family toxin [Acidobacteriota bacterium]